MGADYNDMIARLQMQMATPQGPSFMGLQAPPDQANMQALVAKLQNQQYVNQQGNDGGEWGFINNAGKKDFARAGQSLAGLLGMGQAPPAPQLNRGPAFTLAPQGADGTPADPSTAPTPNQGATPTQSINNMILASKAYYADQVNRGVPADQAKVNTAQALVKWGAPNADKILDDANEQILKNNKTKSETDKDTSQAKMDAASILNQQDEQKNRAATQGFEGQRVNMEQQRIELERQKMAAGLASTDLNQPATPAEQVIAQKMADGDMKLPDPGSRSKTAARYAYLALQLNPDLTQETYGTRQKAFAAIGPGKAGDQVRSFSVAYSHLDTAQEAIDALNNGNMPKFNQIANTIAVQTGSPAPTNLDTALSMIKGELAKGIVGSHAGEADRAAMLAGVTSASSPAALYGAANTAKQLLLGQASGVKQQYGPTMMGKHFNFEDALSPKLRADLAAYETKQNGQSQAPKSSTAPASNGWGQAVVK